MLFGEGLQKSLIRTHNPVTVVNTINPDSNTVTGTLSKWDTRSKWDTVSR